MQSESFPDSLCMNDVIPVFKKGDPNLTDNYRGITVSSVFAKIYSTAWEHRLSFWAEKQVLRSSTQFGFRKKMGALDAIFLLQHLIDKQTSPIK